MSKHTRQSFFALLTFALLEISFLLFGTTNNWAQASSKQGNDFVYAQVIAQFTSQQSKFAEAEKTNPASDKKQYKEEKSDPNKNQDLPWILTSTTFVFVVLLYLLFLRFCPLLLLRLPTEFKVPKTLITEEFSLPLGFVIWLKYHPIVLDAWVKENIDIFEKKFLQHETTVKERNDYYVSLPVKLNNKDINELTVINLRKIFKTEKRVRLLIWGEDAGSGKTTIACQIAQWAMIRDDKKRLNEGHLMLPVLIEEPLTQSGEGMKPLLGAIILKLQDLINDVKFNDELLVKQLLQERRILLIVDHFSKLTHENLKIDAPNFPANALLVTSRLEQKFQGIDINIETLCFDGLRFESFIKQYLENRFNGEFLEEFAQERIVINQQKIPVWLAKLYADRIINANNNLRGMNRYPDNIPDLIIDHLKKLNYDVVKRTNDEYDPLESDAKFIAWKCLEQNYKPTYIEKNSITPDTWKEERFKIFLHRFEKQLYLIRSGKTDTIKFVLAPLAEYLAALYVVEKLNKDKALWNDFLDTATKKQPQEVKSFLLAVRECCLTKEAEVIVPDFVADKLGKLAGLEPEFLRKQKENRYIHQQLMTLLNNDYRVRARAAEALGKLGNTSKRVLLGLVKLLEDNDSYVRHCAVNALRRLGNSSEIVLQGLFERLIHDNSDVYKSIFNTLCELGRSSQELQLQRLLLRCMIVDNHESGTRSRAAKVLGKLGNPSREVLQALLHVIQYDPDFTVRASGAKAFRYLAEELPTNLSDLPEVEQEALREKLPEILQALNVLLIHDNFSEPIEEKKALDRLRNLFDRLRNLSEGN